MVGEVLRRIVIKWQMLVLQEGSAAFQQKNGWDIFWRSIWPKTVKKNILVGVS